VRLNLIEPGKSAQKPLGVRYARDSEETHSPELVRQPGQRPCHGERLAKTTILGDRTYRWAKASSCRRQIHRPINSPSRTQARSDTAMCTRACGRLQCAELHIANRVLRTSNVGKHRIDVRWRSNFVDMISCLCNPAASLSVGCGPIGRRRANSVSSRGCVIKIARQKGICETGDVRRRWPTSVGPRGNVWGIR
jgi:hypothetical protein